jgi:hypothetical protein
MALLLIVLLITAIHATEESYKPEAVLIDPVPRKDTTSLQVGAPPCGGRSKGSAHILAEPGSINPVSWMVIHPSLNANCSVKMMDSEDEN